MKLEQKEREWWECKNHKRTVALVCKWLETSHMCLGCVPIVLLLLTPSSPISKSYTKMINVKWIEVMDFYSKD